MPEASAADALPGVSYVMPVLNEADHVRAAVASLLAQDYAGEIDVVVALGPSIDGTAELLEELVEGDPRVTVVDNVVGSTPAGLNLAIRSSLHPVVVRVDAHAELPRDYTRIAVETMLATGAANVGGVMDARGTTPFERAVALAYGSRLGLGGTRLHRGGAEGPAETVYLGVFRREALTRIGLFDEDIKRGQDWELNRRLRAAGEIVWFTPRLSVVYRPRSSVSRLARQFLSTGLWRGELARRHPGSNGLRYLAPPALVIALAAGTAAGAVGVVRRLRGRRSRLVAGLAVPVLYALGVGAAAVLAPRGTDAATRARLVVVLPAIHLTWGAGFVLGFSSLARDISAHTGR